MERIRCRGVAWIGVAIVGCGLLVLLFPIDFGLHM